jgi:hypothetical protein
MVFLPTYYQKLLPLWLFYSMVLAAVVVVVLILVASRLVILLMPDVAVVAALMVVDLDAAFVRDNPCMFCEF